MSPTNFHLKSILRLIAQRGEKLSFCTQSTTSAEDLDNGIVAERQLACRKIRGYATPESVSELGLSGWTKTFTGSFSCWIVGKDIARTEFSGDARIIRQDRVYQIEYKDFVLDRNVGQLHYVRLIPTAESGSIDVAQPDEIFDDL
jgi:hypothetical protein